MLGNRVVPAGDFENVFSMAEASFVDSMRTHLRRTVVVICSCSVYDECWRYEQHVDGKDRRNEVERCEETEADFYSEGDACDDRPEEERIHLGKLYSTKYIVISYFQTRKTMHAGLHDRNADDRTPTKGDGRSGPRYRRRIAAWGAAALLLLLPLLAMQVTDEVDWNAADFAVFAALLVGAGLAYELAARTSGNTTYRAAVGVALGAAFLLVWMSLGVGMIGSDGHPANLMYGAVLAVGLVGAVVARLQPGGMARALVATALAQALVAVIALAAKLGDPWSGALEILFLNGFFVALFAGSALLFRKAARERAARSGG